MRRFIAIVRRRKKGKAELQFRGPRLVYGFAMNSDVLCSRERCFLYDGFLRDCLRTPNLFTALLFAFRTDLSLLYTVFPDCAYNCNYSTIVSKCMFIETLRGSHYT